MKPSVPALRNLHSIRGALGLPLGIGMLALLSACTGVSAVTKERVAQGETSVQQAQQTLGQSEHGAMELQQAREKIAAAKNALAKGHHEEAERLAAQAHLYAELAVAKSQSATARKSADEVLASLEMLRRESERTSPTTR
jgi:predicted  nucleic acid-binding Zn-ribbon protein